MKVRAVNLYRQKSYHNSNKKLVQSITKPRQYTQKTKHLSDSGMTSEEIQQKIDYLENLHNEIVLTGVLPDTGGELTKEQATVVVVPSAITKDSAMFPLLQRVEMQGNCIAIINDKEDIDIDKITQKIISEYNDKEINIIKVENN